MEEDEAAHTPVVSLDALTSTLHKHHRMKHIKVIKDKERRLSPDTDDRRFKCYQCGRSYKARKDLFKHQRIKHQRMKHNVEVGKCEEKLSYDTDEKRFKCEQCGRSYKGRKDLFKHQHNKHQRMKHNVEVGKFEEKLSYDTDEKRFECEQCGRSYKARKDLFKHQRLKHSVVKQEEGTDVTFREAPQKLEEPLDNCNEKFLFENRLIIHKRSHTGERPFKCDLCGKGFINAPRLYIHKRIIHQNLTCSKCGCTFQNKSQLRAHQAWCLHLGLTSNTGKDQPEDQEELSGDTSFTCDECGKGFAGQRQLLMHQYMHRERKPSKCKYCGVEFASTSSLEEHESEHDKKRPYSCTLCIWTCTRPGNLRMHYLRQHPRQKYNLFFLDDKPHKCEYCGKGFNSQYLLQDHVHVEKSFKCRTFLARQNYCNERDEDGDKPDEFRSNHCDQIFSNSSGLMVHKCTDLSAEKTFTCKDCGTMVKVGTTALSNVFTVANISNVKCFINNHTLV